MTLETSEYVVPVFQVSMKPAFAIPASKEAEYLVDQLPKNFEDNPPEYMRFIEHFGTHYHATANFGGVVRVGTMSYEYSHEAISKEMPTARFITGYDASIFRCC